MADEYEDDGDEQGNDQGQGDNLKALRAEAKRARTLQAELDTLRRDSAFSKALGPTLDTDPRLAYFQKGYDGEMTPEAIRAAATQAGFLGETSPTSTTTTPPDLSGHARLAAASQGAGGPLPPDARDAIHAAKSPEEILDIMESIGRATVRNRPGD